MTASIDLNAYFDRIGWGGPASANYATLAGLLRAHVSRIPFENFDVLLGRGIRLDLESLQNKIVRARRGGYCFELATLFAFVLENLGFHIVRHSARVILFGPATEASRSHMFLTVELPEGIFVVDPGFGYYSSRVPIPLQDGASVRGDHETHWMVRNGNTWMLRAQLGDKPIDAWVTTLEPDNPVDFEMANHYVATYPTSPFVNRIMMSALTADGRVSAMNRDVTIWSNNQPQAVQLADRAALRKLLDQYYGFDLPEVEQLRVPSIPEWQ
jgi:N-hydroxyarylamine O-acetyltransferase